MPKNNEIESIFAETLKQRPEQRAAFLQQRCGDDDDLRRQLESLLEANKAMGDFLENTQSRLSEPEQTQASDSQLDSDSSIHGRFLPGTVIDNRYRIVSLSGRGGMGEVYRADDLKLGHTVALKFLPPDLVRDPKRLAYFHQEVRLTRQISHPNVCRVYDIGEVNGQPFLSMEYIDGEDLRVLLRRIGRLPPDKGVEIAQQLCAGLAAAHEKGVLHRDLKPANIMLDGRGQVRITDFGLAKLVDERQKGEIAGTPAYMAPEQLLDGQTSKQSDLYSLGLVLAEMLLGKPVIANRNVTDLITHHRSSESSIESLSSVDIDPIVERAVLACLQRRPADRPTSARELAMWLPGGDPLEAAIAAGRTPSPELVANAQDKDQLPLLWAVMAMVIICLGIAASMMFASKRIRMLETSPQVLSDRCEEILEQLGYPDLPANTASGATANLRLVRDLDDGRFGGIDAWLTEHHQPSYLYWRRWTDGTFVAEHFHAPYGLEFESPVSHSKQYASVIVDGDGKLLRLEVQLPEREVGESAEGEPTITDSAAVNWAAVVKLAGFDLEQLTQSPIESKPPVFCEDSIAWVTADDRQIQAGLSNGKVNYFEIVGVSEMMEIESEGSPVIDALFRSILLLIILVAWLNVRSGRADWSGAIHAALLMGGLYFALEVVSINPTSTTLSRDIFGLLGERAWGHVLVHVFDAGAMYLAIEPYVRRYWPRSLVGLARFLSFRWNDATIGKELLIGITSGGAIGLLGYSTGLLVDHERLFDPMPQVASAQTWTAARMHMLSGVFLTTFILVSFGVVARAIFKREAASYVSLLILLTLMFSRAPEEASWARGIIIIGALLLSFALFTRVGFLAALVSVWTAAALAFTVPPNLDGWYAGYAIVSYGFILVVAMFGFATSQGGILKLLKFLEPPA